MRVAVYWNLHKKVWSVQSMEGLDKGKVIGHYDSLSLVNTVLKVSPAGNARVRREGAKNVHAKIHGTFVDPHPTNLGYDNGQKIRYNPYTMTTFQVEDGSPITRAPAAHFQHDGRVMVYA